MTRLTAISSLQIASLMLAGGIVACSSAPTGRIDAGPGWMSVPDSGPTDSGTAMDAGMDGGTVSDGGTVTDGGAADAGTPPTIRSMTPPLGSVLGGTNIVIFGSGFANGFAPNGGIQANAMTTISFGGNAIPINTGINVIDDTTLEVVSPAGKAGKADVTLTNPNGTVTCSGCYTYVAQITVTKVAPFSGSTLGGDMLTITGQGFAPGMLVVVGGSEATGININSAGDTITCFTPPGIAGSADVGVVGPDTSGWLRRGFVYYAPVEVSGVKPASSPLAGGGMVTVTGSGFTPDSQVLLGTQAATTTYVSATELTAQVPAATTAGAVPATVQTSFTSGALPNGFAYYDNSADLQIYAVVPAQAPLAGGIGVELLGTGLVQSNGLQVKFGTGMATIVGGSANDLTVTVPAAAAPGVVDVQARTTTGGVDLPQAFAYVAPLSAKSISPATGPEAGGTAATISGSGLSSSCSVFVGAGQATVTGAASDGSSLSITIPAGSSGARDVRVACGSPGMPGYQQATLAGAFTYSAPMQLLSLTPNTGAIAGNTAVTLYGNGFVNGMQVLFGSGSAAMLNVQSANIATLRTPPGQVGYVDVTVLAPGESAPCAAGAATCSTLPQAFGYYNPANVNGGGSNGAMLGILNVTVLNSTPGESGPIPGATVSINQDQLTGITDQNGQVTFSDPSLLKPVNITASMMGFAASTIAHINARDVTLFMQANTGGPPSPGGGGPQAAVFSGKVCGFKLPQGTTLAPGQQLQAQVFQSFPYVYAAPPFGLAQTPVVVTTDCGAFMLATGQFGPTALYAEFGIADNTKSPPTFTPISMGVIRGLEANPGATVSGLDIILSMHLDKTFPVTIDESALGLGGTMAIMNEVFSYLDLGGEGVIPLATAQSTQAQFPFTNHPDIEGQGLVFLNLAAVYDASVGSVQPPYSLCFQRQYGQLSAGVNIGPMMAFTEWITPMAADVFSGSLSWTFLGGDPANIEQVEVSQPMGFSSVPIWDVILPGSDESVAVPASASATFPKGAALQWMLITAQSPRLTYNTFGFEQLGVNDWNSFTENFGSFNTAP